MHDILTAKSLAEELGITIDDAKTLMLRDDFPATETAPGSYVVARDRLKSWVEKHSRGNSRFAKRA